MARAAARLYLHFGLPGAALVFLLEGLGIPIPVEVPLGITGLRIAQGLNTYWQMVLLMFSSTVVGNTIGYAIGYFGGRPVARKVVSWLRISPERWEQAERWFLRHGLKVVLATRWINWAFAQNMWLCGITRIAFWRFFTVMVINDLLWAMAWTWLAQRAFLYFRHSKVLAFLRDKSFTIGLTAMGIVLLALVISWILYRIRQRKAK